MSQGTTNPLSSANPDGDSPPPKKPRIDWEDPSVPVGNAPSLPRWPLFFFGTLWVAFLGFLLAMAIATHRPG